MSMSNEIHCKPMPTAQPGIFRCAVCGLQNPRPIKKPFSAVCRAHAPRAPVDPERFSDSYSDIDRDFIRNTLCGNCDRRANGHCSPDPDAETPCARAGWKISQLIQNGGSCPMGKW